MSGALPSINDPAKEINDRINVSILVAERHPTQSGDAAIEKFAASLPCKSRICFHASLDEALLKSAGGKRLSDWLKAFGLDENSSISHPMVSKAIVNAQKKIEGMAIGTSTADSAEQWLVRNVPGYITVG